MHTIYDFTVRDCDNADVKLDRYEGKVLLVVNTATECGFTPTYADLQRLYADLEGRGLEILDFPCDQFGHQAPGTSDEIHARDCLGVTQDEFGNLLLLCGERREKGLDLEKNYPVRHMRPSISSKLYPSYIMYDSKYFFYQKRKMDLFITLFSKYAQSCHLSMQLI